MDVAAEIYSMITVKLQMQRQKLSIEKDRVDLRFCYDILQHVSRSFSAVIIQLDEELRDAVCLFYLLLRALDTVEDDMSVEPTLKQSLLTTLHEKVYEPTWNIDGIGVGKERLLLNNFHRLSSEIRGLKTAYQQILMDICARMGLGMAEFLVREVQSKQDFDRYCHYVAGLVGHGLTRLFVTSGLEHSSLGSDLTAANHMGLFLQKVNIIRDYYEDIMEEPPRVFWPTEVWSRFATNFHDFKEPTHRSRGVECLNYLIADALRHLPHCVEYMSQLQTPSIFSFCAVPQIMAIATLVELYNNGRTFNSKVKIRKGLACRLLLECTHRDRFLSRLLKFIDDLAAKASCEDPSFDQLCCRLSESRACISEHLEVTPKKGGSYARALITTYPALGGRVLYSVIDNVSGYFQSE